MPKVSLYIACSLDGYIARPDGDIEWLSLVEIPGEDYGYQAFYNSVDGLLIGARTFEQILSWGEWPHGDRATFVFSHHQPPALTDNLYWLSGNPVDELHSRLKDSHHLWLVGGAELIEQFQRQNAIDEYIISFIPVLLGEGIPLFKPQNQQQVLRLLDSRSYPSGLVQHHYLRDKL